MTSRRNQGTAVQRLKKDFMRIQQEKLPYIEAAFDPKNILNLHYVLEGPPDTMYHGGYYWGVIKFPSDFPFNAPNIMMKTPSGRFKPNTKLCLSNSGFHQETWCPSWSISTILTGLLSFMLEKQPTYGSLETTDAQKKKLAKESLQFNLQNAEFCDLFPQIADEIREKLDKEKKSTPSINNEQTNVTNRSSTPVNNHNKIIQSIILNLLIIIAFIIVIFICKYVIYFTA